MKRREFIRRAAGAAAVAAASARVAAAGEPRDRTGPAAGAIPVRPFGKTGKKLPILGYGGAALPTKWGNPLSAEDRVKLVRYAYDRGVRFFDTAGNYMESQTLMGHGFKGIRRNVFLATKVETTMPSEVRGAVEKSLKELQTDYLDLIQIHGTPGLEQMTVKRAMQIHGELVKLKDERIVRMIGFTAHSYFDKALAMIDSGGFEQCMLAYGYLARGDVQLHSPRMQKLCDECLSKAHDRGMAVVAMKVVGAGAMGAWSQYFVPQFDKSRLKGLPGGAIRYVLGDKRVDLLVVGMRLKHEVDANIMTISVGGAFSKGDEALLKEYRAQLLETERFKKMRVD
ncbi:MAG: aldo/keto reductase [Planctomycetota bacterium]|jgi:predicted aldo/keto reductase-like oxidoreductase